MFGSRRSCSVSARRGSARATCHAGGWFRAGLPAARDVMTKISVCNGTVNPGTGRCEIDAIVVMGESGKANIAISSQPAALLR
jgi:hypothetical protein